MPLNPPGVPGAPGVLEAPGVPGAPAFRVLPAGPRAVLLELAPAAGEPRPGPLAAAAAVAGLATAVRRRLRSTGRAATDVVPGACTVLVDGIDAGDRALLRELVEAGAEERGLEGDGSGPAGSDAGPGGGSDAGPGGGSGAGPGAPVLELPTVYDGPDLAAVARLWRVDAEEVVARHTGLVFQAAFCGFAPGFAYLAGLPAAWAVPRRGESRPAVPAGSVALAGAWCGVYPRASPGGWQLVGRTAVTLFDADAVSPALLAPGVRVRFVRAG